MAKRDVELIIRAKNEASRNLDAITASEKKLLEANEKLASSGGKVGTALSQVGTDAAKLKAQISGLESLGSVVTVLDRAASGLGRLQQEASEGEAKLGQLKTGLDGASQAANAASAKFNAGAAALKKLREESARAKQAQTEANAAVRAAQSSYDSLAAKIKKAVTPNAELTTAFAKQSDELAQLKSAQSAAASAYDDIKTKIAAQLVEQKGLSAAQVAAKKNVADLAAATERAETALAKSNTSLATAKTEFAQLTTFANQASAALGNVALNQEAVAAASAKAATALAQSQKSANFQRFENRFQDRSGVQANFKAFEASVGSTTPLSQFKSALNDLKAAVLGVDSAFNKTSGGAGIFRRALAAITGETRQALGIVERLRGQVLSLAAGYVGFYAAVGQIGGVINAFRQTEAAQNRLGAALKQDTNQTASELRFLNQEAERLGVSFGTLADEYSKFVVAGQAANFSLEATRKIFLSVAEAGRVNKLTNEQISGTFLALTQSISKGKIQSEELRRQLGDRLPGAFVLMAKALNVSTAELDRMLEAGEVLANESNMLAFARVLTDEFGGQLPKSLKTLSTELGRFENTLFQAQTRVANGGFAEALRVNLEKLNTYFNSRAGRDFFLQLGAALGQATNLIGVFVDNIGAITTAFKLLLSYKIAQFIGAFYTQLLAANPALKTLLATEIALTGATGLFTRAKAAAAATTGVFSRAVVFAATSVTTLRGGMSASAAASALFTGGIRAATGAMTLLSAAMRAVPLLAFAAGVSLLVGYMTDTATEVPGATSALDEHERVIGEVSTAYREAAESGGKFLDKVKNVNALTAAANFDKITTELEKLSKEYREFLSENLPKSGGNAERQRIIGLVEAFKDGKKSAAELNREFEAFLKTTKDGGIRDFILSIGKETQKIEELEKAQKEAAAVATEFGVANDKAREIVEATGASVKGMVGAVEEAEKTFKANEGLTKYNDAMVDLSKNIPSVSEELKELDALKEIEDDFRRAAAEAQTFSQVLGALDVRAQALQALKDQNFNFEADFTGRRGTSAGRNDAELVSEITKLATTMKLSAKDLLTAISFETGGTLNPGIRGGAGNRHVGLIQFGPAEQRQWGITVASSIGEQVKAIGGFLKERGVKEGDGLLQIYAAINAGNAKRINASDANNGGTPGTVLDKVSSQMEGHKRRAEGLLAAYAGVTTEIEKQIELENKNKEQTQKDAEKKIKDQQDFNAEIQKKIDLDKFEAANLAETARQQAINKAINDAEVAAKEKGLSITKEQKAAIAEAAAASFDAANKEKLASEERKKIEEEVNRLIEMRRELIEQIKAAEESGDTDKAASLQGKLDETNTALQAAIANAQAFYAKMGGPEADLATLKLDGVKNGIQSVQRSMLDTKAILGDFVNGLAGAFDSAAQSIAGFLDGTLSAKDALKGVRDAFLKFAADFLRQIAQMIIKQALFNALGGGGGGGGGGIFGFLGKIFHAGGMVGSSDGASRAVSPSVWAGATRMHTGGIAGLRANEVPIIAEKGEEMLTADDPRHRNNLGKGGSSAGAAAQNIRVINTFDATSYLEQALATPEGERVIMNALRANQGAVQNILG